MTSTPATTPVSTAQPAAGRTRARTRVLAVLGATAAALGIWVLAEALGVDLAVQLRPGSVEAVGPAAVLLSSLVAALAGWAALAVLERLVAWARTAWTVLALLVLAASMVGPLAGGTSTAAKAALAGMHLAVAAVLVPALGRSSAAR
ncbi:MAG: DUF6069 family protein [Actinomycetota bacterium]|nr:DUF6069 family protein [Actinomycetota bacterium]